MRASVPWRYVYPLWTSAIVKDCVGGTVVVGDGLARTRRCGAARRGGAERGRVEEIDSSRISDGREGLP